MPIRDFANKMIETEAAYTSVTSGWTTLVDLGNALLYKGVGYVSTLDADALLRVGTSVFTVKAGFAAAYDVFQHNGVVSIKYKTDAPTDGAVIVQSW